MCQLYFLATTRARIRGIILPETPGVTPPKEPPSFRQSSELFSLPELCQPSLCTKTVEFVPVARNEDSLSTDYCLYDTHQKRAWESSYRNPSSALITELKRPISAVSAVEEDHR